MTQGNSLNRVKARWRRRLTRSVGSLALGTAALGGFAVGTGHAPLPVSAARADDKPAPGKIDFATIKPPASGVMSFVVADFVPPIVAGMDACPKGTAPRLRDEYLRTLSPEEQARLRLKANEAEFTRRWHGYAFGPNNTNICSQPDMFQHTAYPGVESRLGWGLKLDSDGSTCAHARFQSPDGEKGIDNQEYRAMGCTLEMRGANGDGGDALTGMQQFHKSGEWTQVLILKGVTSFANADNVEVIYANTADRPDLDAKGNFLPGMSFTISDKGARHRNVLHGRIRNGVLTTDPADIKLAQTWGQGGARDIRGQRTRYHYVHGRLRLEFTADGSLRGFVGGYRPLFDVIASTSLGGDGAAVVAGIDCSAELAALKQNADGLRDPKTGQCGGVSSAMRIRAIPAFVTDLPAGGPAAQRIALR